MTSAATDKVYEARPIKRVRATKEEMADRYKTIAALATEHGPCSVRHIYYQAVASQMPGITKTRNGYMKVQLAVLKLRRDGTIPYRLIVDSTRWARKPDTWESLDAALEDLASWYRRDLWVRSDSRLEVWCESDSIASTIADITGKWDVPLMVSRGQSSETFAFNAALTWIQTPKRQPVVLYVGDHDPAGLEIENTLLDKLGGFTEDCFEDIQWKRIGVTWNQIEELDLPGTKPKKKYGYPYSVEAEALPPKMLRALIDHEIERHVDRHEYEVLRTTEASERQILEQMRTGLKRASQ